MSNNFCLIRLLVVSIALLLFVPLAAPASEALCPIEDDLAIAAGYRSAVLERRQNEDRLCNTRTDAANNRYVSFPGPDDHWCKLTDKRTSLLGEGNKGFCLVAIVADDAPSNVIGLFRKERQDRESGIYQIAMAGSSGEAEGLLVSTIGPCAPGSDCTTDVLTDEAHRFVTLSSARREVFVQLADGFVEFLRPEVVSTTLNGEPVESIAAVFESGALRLRLMDQAAPVGQLRLEMADRWGETRRVTITLQRAEGYNDNPTVLGLQLELALAKKLIADELFLRLSSVEPLDETGCPRAAGCDIYEKYQEARSVLPRCQDGGRATRRDDCSVLSADQLATIRLIEADIAYREILLRNGIPFFGGYRSQRPTTPHQELIKLQTLLERMVATSERMERWQFRAADLELKELENAADRIYALGQTESEKRRANIERVRSSNFDASIAKFESRKSYLENQMVYISQRAEMLAEQQDTLTMQSGKLVQAGIATATGVPVEEIEALAKGDLEDAITSYVVSEVEDQAGEYFDKLMANSEYLGDAYSDFRRKEAELSAAITEVKQYELEFRALHSALEGSLDEARQYAESLSDEIGTALLAKLSRNEQAILENIVTSSKPVGALIQAAQDTLGEVVSERDKWIAHYDAMLRAAKHVPIDNDRLESLWMDVSSDTLTQLTSEEMERVRVLTLSALKASHGNYNEFHDDVVHLYPDFLRHPAIQAAVAAANPDDVEAIRRALIDGTAPGLVEFDRQEGTLRIKARRARTWTEIDYRRLVDDLIKNYKPALSSAAIVRFFEENREHFPKEIAFIVSRSVRGGAQVASDLDRELRKTKDEDKLSKAWSALETVASREAMNATKAKVLSSIAFRQQEAVSLPPTLQTGDLGVQPGASELSPEANVALNAALNSAFPGAGVALQLGQTWASMDANRALLKALDEQMLHAMAEYNHVISAIDQANVNSVIAKLEAERTNALAEAARAQLQQFNFVMDLVHDEAKLMEQRLRLYRPYFFYNAELLRERFDAFDRSLSIWSTGRTDSGFFAREIQRDPRNARLALDSEIHLFGWLNREREATKTDPYHLVNHWQQLVALAEDYCADYGCKPGVGALGKIAATVPVRLLRDLAGPDSQRSFANWRRSDDRTGGFSVPLTLTTAHRLVPPYYTNVRLLDVNVVALDRRGRRMEGNVVQLRHSGVSKVPYFSPEDRSLTWTDEQLLPSTLMPPSNATSFDLTRLAQRFQSQVDQVSLLSLRGLEGYGFYGAYEVLVMDNPIVDRIEDFEIQIAYIYQEADEIRDEGDFISRLDRDGTRCSFSEEPIENNDIAATNVGVPSAYCAATLDISMRASDERGRCVGKEWTQRISDHALINAWLDIRPTTPASRDNRAYFSPLCMRQSEEVRPVRMSGGS